MNSQISVGEEKEHSSAFDVTARSTLERFSNDDAKLRQWHKVKNAVAL